MERPRCSCFAHPYPDLGDQGVDTMGGSVAEFFEFMINQLNLCPEAEEWAGVHAVLGVATYLAAQRSNRLGQSLERETKAEIDRRVLEVVDALSAAARAKLDLNEKMGKTSQ